MYKVINVINNSVRYNRLDANIHRCFRCLKSLYFVKYQFILARLDIRNQNHTILVFIHIDACVSHLDHKFLSGYSLALIIYDLHPDITLHRACQDGKRAHRHPIFVDLIRSRLIRATWYLCVKKVTIL